MCPEQPEAGPRRAVPQGLPGIADVLQPRPPLARAPVARIPRLEPPEPVASPADSPAAYGPDAHAIPTGRRGRPLGHGIRQHRESVPDPQPILPPDPLERTHLDHQIPSPAVAGDPSHQRGSILSRYFTRRVLALTAWCPFLSIGGT